MSCVGIVGHRYLTNSETIAFVAQQSLVALKQAEAEHSEVVALSAIAEGADTLFAEAALTLDIPLEIVRPFAEYEADFETHSAKGRYEKLRASARSEDKLPFGERSILAYEAAMNWIVRRSDLLLVAWDGLPAEGAGGTGDAAKQATLLQRSANALYCLRHPVFQHQQIIYLYRWIKTPLVISSNNRKEYFLRIDFDRFWRRSV